MQGEQKYLPPPYLPSSRGLASFSSIFHIYRRGARVSVWRFSFLTLWVVVVPVDIFAYSLVRWATFRLQKVKKQRERWKTKARKGKDEKENKTSKHEPPPPSEGGFLGHFLGENGKFDLHLAHWLRLWPYSSSGARGPPQSLKNAPKCMGKWKSSCEFSSIPGIAPRVSPRIVVFAFHKSWDASPRMGFRIPRFPFFWTPRIAPRIPRNAPRTPRMAFSLRERFSWNCPRNLWRLVLGDDLQRLKQSENQKQNPENGQFFEFYRVFCEVISKNPKNVKKITF